MIVVGLSPILDLLHFIHACVDTHIRYDVAETVHPLRVEVDFVSTYSAFKKLGQKIRVPTVFFPRRLHGRKIIP